MRFLLEVLALTTVVPLTLAKCYDPSPAFPVPLWANGKADLHSTFQKIEKQLADIISDGEWDTSSYSIEVTSNTETLWSNFHTAREQNATRPGVQHVDEDSIYRIASITKVFTVLALLHEQKAGSLSLDDTVAQHIPELAGPDSGALPWKDITLRILASQLSGIPREFAQGDLIMEQDLVKYGLPPATKERLPLCSPCSRRDLLDNLKTRQPIYAPNFKSTYSNVAFELLGIVIEEVAGMNYSDYIRQSIFEPLGMSFSSLEKPSDEHAVLPVGYNYWDDEEGIQAPTGGIYASSADMSKFGRYILTHYNALATGVNWMLPASWATGMNNFYGMPFEIFRTDRLLKDSKRPVTFVMKSGSVPAYFSRMSVMPEYGLSLVILIGGNNRLLDEIQNVVTVELIRAAEDVIWHDVEAKYTGTYTAIDHSLNSSLSLTASAAQGLILSSFISNSSDVFQTLLPLLANEIIGEEGHWRVQLTPTLLYKNQSAQSGQIWRMQMLANWPDEVEERPVWDDVCSTDVDPLSYAGLPLTEVVFWHQEGVVELPAWKVKMKRSERSVQDGKGLVVQRVGDFGRAMVSAMMRGVY